MVARLLSGSLSLALAGMLLASLLATLVAVRVATETDVDALFFAETRHPLVQLMLDSLGRDRTTLVLYLVQRSFDAVVLATAVSPLFVWLLGSSAVHAAARLGGIRRPYRPMLVFFAFATALALVPANAATLLFGSSPPGSQFASLVGLLCLVSLAVLVYRGVRAHYGVPGTTAIRILIVALVLFYLVPLLLMLAAVIAIIVAAIVLEYF